MQSVCTLARHADLSLPSPPQISVFFYLPNATLMPMNHDSKRAGYVRVNKSDQGEDRRDERRDKADPPQGLQHQAVGFVKDFLCTISTVLVLITLSISPFVLRPKHRWGAVATRKGPARRWREKHVNLRSVHAVRECTEPLGGPLFVDENRSLKGTR